MGRNQDNNVEAIGNGSSNTSADTKKSSKAKNSKKKTRKPKAGLIFWTSFAVIILICFLVARGRIASVLKETDFFNEVTGSEPALITDLINSQDSNSAENSKKEAKQKSAKPKKTESSEKSAKSAKEKVKDITEKATQKKEKKQSKQEKQKIQEEALTQQNKKDASSGLDRSESELTERTEIVGKAEKKIEKEAAKEAAEVKSTAENTTKDSAKPEEKKSTETKPAEPQKQMMAINLCFVQIEDDGTIVRRESIRSVEKNDSPLTTAINTLLAGPNMSELQKGCMSVIPQNSRLLSVKISNKTAILNFNEEFTYNGYGVQGQITQLMQVVYTATSFSTIDNVQFLIEGQKLEYIGGEGVWIGSPLSRFSFK